MAVIGKEGDGAKGTPNVPEIVDIPAKPAVTSLEGWRKVITGRKVTKAAGTNTQYRNKYEVLRYEGEEENGERDEEEGEKMEIKAVEAISEDKDYHVDTVSEESLDSAISEVISQDSIYVPMDGKDYRVVETDFYVQGNPKAV